uniref:Glutathione-S-transferase n=1 Tax=Alternaria alternata TaxID=5599 RepID=GST_ALTAL|nr:RecName: Full=Glutathione-S-transferase; AltName: Allergen=Alt a 13 [Alternaria alternata]AAR98813.1 glutathione-S-transferase [Alternaria alternata]
MSDKPSELAVQKLVLFAVKGTATSTHNTVRPLILLDELGVPHEIYVVDRVSAPWFTEINPHRMVPVILEKSPDGRDTLRAWESTSTLMYIADAYDKDGTFGGRNVQESSDINNWLTLHTAALGPTAKYWLYFYKLHPEKLPKTIEKLRSNITVQYDILERRLNEPGQQYLAWLNEKFKRSSYNRRHCYASLCYEKYRRVVRAGVKVAQTARVVCPYGGDTRRGVWPARKST